MALEFPSGGVWLKNKACLVQGPQVFLVNALIASLVVEHFLYLHFRITLMQRTHEWTFLSD